MGFKKEFDYNKIRNIDQLNKRIGGQKLEKSFIYIKLNKSFTKLNIIEVELKPIYDGLAFNICIKYEKEKQGGFKEVHHKQCFLITRTSIKNTKCTSNCQYQWGFKEALPK